MTRAIKTSAKPPRPRTLASLADVYQAITRVGARRPPIGTGCPPPVDTLYKAA